MGVKKVFLIQALMDMYNYFSEKHEIMSSRSYWSHQFLYTSLKWSENWEEVHFDRIVHMGKINWVHRKASDLTKRFGEWDVENDAAASSMCLTHFSSPGHNINVWTAWCRLWDERLHLWLLGGIRLKVRTQCWHHILRWCGEQVPVFTHPADKEKRWGSFGVMLLFSLLCVSHWLLGEIPGSPAATRASNFTSLSMTFSALW